MYVILFLVLILLLSYRWRIWYKATSPVPAGPIPWPLIGNIHQLGKNPALQLSKWANQFGNLYTIYFGSQPALVISDASLMRQFFNRSECCGRMKTAVLDDIYLRGGILYASGKVWQDQRPVFVRNLRSIERKSYHQEFIRDEIFDFGNWLEETMARDGKVYLFEQLKVLSSNIIWSFVCGSRQDTDIAGLLNNWIHGLQRVTSTGAIFFDKIAQIAPGWSGERYFRESCKKLQKFVFQQFEQEKGNTGQSDNIISNYLKLVNRNHDVGSTFYGQSGYEEVLDSVLAIVINGTESTASSLNWMLFYLCTHPEIQAKIYKEVSEIGGEVELKHRKVMPYTEAFIEESQRKISIAPFGMFHEVEEDLEWNGKTIKKGVLLIGNIYHVHNDKKIWSDPDQLRPERFLVTENGKRLHEFMVGFQPGKRVCPGESLARDVMFLAITNLSRNFVFEMEEVVSKESYLEADRAFISLPKPLSILVKRRQ